MDCLDSNLHVNMYYEVKLLLLRYFFYTVSLSIITELILHKALSQNKATRKLRRVGILLRFVFVVYFYCKYIECVKKNHNIISIFLSIEKKSTYLFFIKLIHLNSSYFLVHTLRCLFYNHHETNKFNENNSLWKRGIFATSDSIWGCF